MSPEIFVAIESEVSKSKKIRFSRDEKKKKWSNFYITTLTQRALFLPNFGSPVAIMKEREM